MVIADIPERLKRFDIPGRVTLQEGNGEMPKVEVETDWSSAEIYLHGAHVTDFGKKGEPPLLFTSHFSRFQDRQPIRGGIPVIFPWFGDREGEPAHGYARLADWDLHEATTVPEGGVSLRFSLADRSFSATCPPFQANYVVTVTDQLTLELIITNASGDQPFTFETCLHSYFTVSDASAISITVQTFSIYAIRQVLHGNELQSPCGAGQLEDFSASRPGHRPRRSTSSAAVWRSRSRPRCRSVVPHHPGRRKGLRRRRAPLVRRRY